MAPSHSVIILVADGARPDTLDAAMRDGTLPALARIRQDGGWHTVTTVFPSVTGPAYAPFLLGRHPGAVGLPGLRWYDRSRAACGWPGHARSYVGMGMRHIDRDLLLHDETGEIHTLFEFATSSVGALSVIGRGLSRHGRVGRGAAFVARAATTHFRGNVRGWLGIDRTVGETVVHRVQRERPAFTFAALTGIDKASHAAGHDAPIVREAMAIVDDTVARLRADAERAGYWSSLQLWVVSDHGHSRVLQHDDLDAMLRGLGYRVLAHPWLFTHAPDIALMVSGNAMAHLYLAPRERRRQFWPVRDERGYYGVGRMVEQAARRPRKRSADASGTLAVLAPEWYTLVEALAERPSIDLMLLPQSPTSCVVLGRGRGGASLSWEKGGVYTYRPETGDPLGLGEVGSVNADTAYAVTRHSNYPDALVQIATLCACERSGDVILSATHDWDFRARYEPIPHVSSHGALHRDHMLVPLLTNHPTAGVPRRTVDVMPSAARVLGVDPGAVSGVPFV